jgi:hypothetical protein
MGTSMVENRCSIRLLRVGEEMQLVHKGKYDFQGGIREDWENTQCLMCSCGPTFSNVNIHQKQLLQVAKF